MKKLFVFIVTLSLVVSVIWAGTPIPGTVVAAKITTGNTDNTFSIGDTIEMLGTCKQVADNTARDAIPAERRAEGMQVWVIATQTAWRLVGGIANTDWQVIKVSLPADASGALTNDGVGNLGWNPSVGVSAVVVPGQNISIKTNAGPAYQPNVVGTLTNNTTGRAGFVDDISTNQIPLTGVTNAGTAAYSNANVFAFLSANNVFTGGSNHFIGDVGIDGSQYVGTLVPTNITGPVFSVPMPFVGSNGSGAFGFSYNGGALTGLQASAISNLRTQWSVGDITNAGNLAYSNSIKVANVSDAGNLAYSNSIKVANITDAGTLAYSNSTPNAAGALTNNGTGTKGWYSGYAPLDAANVFTGSNFVNNTIEAIQHGVTTNAWSGPTNDIDLSIERVDYVTTTPLKVTGFINKPTKFEHSVVLTVSNSTAVDKIMYLPSGLTTDDGQSSYTVTNQSLRIFSFRYNPNNYTNAVSRQFPGGSTGNSGTVTSVNVAIPGLTSSGAVTTSGTITMTPPSDLLTNATTLNVQLSGTSNNVSGAVGFQGNVYFYGTNTWSGVKIMKSPGAGTTVVNLGLDANSNVVTNASPAGWTRTVIMGGVPNVAISGAQNYAGLSGWFPSGTVGGSTTGARAPGPTGGYLSNLVVSLSTTGLTGTNIVFKVGTNVLGSAPVLSALACTYNSDSSAALYTNSGTTSVALQSTSEVLLGISPNTAQAARNYTWSVEWWHQLP